MTISEFDDLDPFGKAFDAGVAMRQYAEQMLATTVRQTLHQIEDQIVGEAKQYYGTDKAQGMLLAAEIVRLNMTPEETA